MVERDGAGQYLAHIQYVEAKWAWVAVAVTTSVLLVRVIAGPVLGTPGLVYSLAVPAGILFGIAGALGFALGGLLALLWAAAVSPAAAVQVGGDFILASGAYVLWNRRPIPEVTDGWRELLSGLWGYVLTATSATLCSVAVVSLGLMLLDSVPFAAAVSIRLEEQLVFVFGVGPVILVVLHSILGPVPTTSARTAGLTNLTRLSVAAVALTWVSVAFLLSLLKQDITSIPGARSDLYAVVPGPLTPLANLALGPSYRLVQLLGAVLALALMTWLVSRPFRSVEEQSA